MVHPFAIDRYTGNGQIDVAPVRKVLTGDDIAPAVKRSGSVASTILSGGVPSRYSSNNPLNPGSSSAPDEDLQKKFSQYASNPDWTKNGVSNYTAKDVEGDFQTAYSLAVGGIPHLWAEAKRKGVSRAEYDEAEKQRQYIGKKYGIDPTDADALDDLTNNLNEISQYVDQMTDAEKAVLSYMFRTEGAQSAVNWFNTRRYGHEKELAGKTAKEMEDYGKEKPLLASLKSVGLNQLAPIEYVADSLRFSGTDEKYINSMADQANALRAGVMDKYDWDIAGWDAFDFLYGTGMSMVDSGVSMLKGPFAELSLGLNAAAHATNDAFKRGMDKKSAARTGLIAGATEALFEHLSIGNFRALKEVDAATIKDIVKNIGKSMLTNASEETLTEISNLVYDDIANGDYSQWEINYQQRIANGGTPQEARRHAWGDAIGQVVEAGASGALMGFGFGAIGSAGTTVQGSKKNALTANEKKVVDKVYNDRIAEAEKNGEKVNKSKVWDSVIEEMEKGAISTDTIEEVLGGETYKTYKDTVDSEDALQKEFDELSKVKAGEATLEQQARHTELRQKLADISKNSNRSQLKQQLGAEVSELVKGDRLAESYNQKARRGQAFEADLTQYGEKQRAIVKNAIDSGILNNTRRSHDLVDMISKVCADKGLGFDFANNQKLKESGFALEGKTVNGYLSAGGITLNVDSPKVLNAVVGHEITHVFEDTELYQPMQEALFACAKSKGEYDSRLKAVTELYQGIEGADPVKELTADLIGDYLFTDSDFVNRLSTENRNVFQKIYDEIKYLCKVATAGSKEARQLEKVKKIFAEVYRTTEAKTNTAQDGGVKYSLRDLDIERNYIDYTDVSAIDAWVNSKVDDLINRGKVVQLSAEIISNYQSAVDWTEKGAVRNLLRGVLEPHLGVSVEFAHDGDSAVAYLTRDGIDHSVGGNASPKKAAAFDAFAELVKNAEYAYSTRNDRHSNINKKIPGKIDWDSFIAVAMIEGNPYPVVFKIRSVDMDVRSQIYEITTKNETGSLRGDGTQDNPANAHPSYEGTPISSGTVTQDTPGVKGQLSLSGQNEIAPPRGNFRITGKDISLEGVPIRSDIAPAKTNPALEGVPIRKDLASQANAEAKMPHISLEEYANSENPVWRNVAYNDDATKARIMQETHNAMVAEGVVVKVTDDVTNNVDQAFPDLRSMKKTERNPILKTAMKKLKADLRNFLNGFKDQSFEFEVNGKVLDATLYNTGINEVLEKVTKEKANMLYSTEGIFKNARYLYSTPDYDGDPNVYRWNYFYTPVEIGNETVGVRIAVRDVSRGVAMLPESQIYNWGIKKDASLDGGRRGPKVASSDVSSDAPHTSLGGVGRGINNRSSNDASSDVFINNIPQDGENVNVAEKFTRKDLHQGIIDDAKAKFAEAGLDFDEVLKNAKNLSTFATVDNTPQRVMEKALGYKAGQVLSDLTVNKVAQNETEGIKWLNSFTDRKNGLLAQISKQYHIKPGSKESAAAQMYAEGFYVNSKNEIIQYGDAELAKDFPDTATQKNIKGLASDPRIRQIYDETLAMINDSRTKNAYPEIPRLDNYFLHFRAMDDTFSRLGLPFNPNDIRAKDLPTDLNGVTADLKPGQPYFASAMHREGKRTSFDLLGGLERYLTSAKNQIFHIDDIQTLRALRNYVADTYGQANGLEGLDALSEEEQQERIKQVYNAHLSTFAKFLNEEANVLAGKTSLIDRGLEGVIGRRGITFLNTVNQQVGKNMVGFNISSSLTNFLPVAQTVAKTNKFDFLKAFAQTASNKISSIFGKNDGFAESSPVMIRRKGADSFYRTPWQKVGDAGYVLMSAVDDISTELIARTKYNELTRKGMDSQKAHIETDKWVSRLMGDRSLGQQPQLYNSKMLGLVTKFQLEVRNQLDSQFYDTIQEAKVATENIENGLARNAKKAAKIASTFVQLAVVQHLFGKAFESVAGYNPAFDIIDVLIKVFGWDDEEDDEDTVLDNIEEGFLALLEDLPYTSTFTGGRIPISSALPIEQLVTGKDDYGNEVSRWDTVKSAAPYYVLPGGYGQVKKTYQGLKMFDNDLPIAGSYTDKGALRFPVEDTVGNRVQAGLFGQYASENARDYFDNDRTPLKEKQIQEFIDVDIPIRDYWEYREGLSGLSKLEEKADYIDSLDLPVAKKNLLINNIADRKEPIDMTNYGKYGSFEEFDFAEKNPEKYAVAKSVGGYKRYQSYSDDLYNIKADKDQNGKSISGSRKGKVIAYINNLDADYGEKIILFKSEYPADDTYNYEIIDYLNGRQDISYKEMETILKELGFKVDSEGRITWD